MGTLYYGDNFDILTRDSADESVDLVYPRGRGGDKRGMVDGRVLAREGMEIPIGEAA